MRSRAHQAPLGRRPVAGDHRRAGATSEAVRDRNHIAAWRWIGTRDYRRVCEMADICPDRLATALAPRVALAKAGNYTEAARGLVSDGRMDLRHVP